MPRIDLPQGTLDLLILRTLSLETQHGWGISERVQQMSSEVLRIQQGSLYLRCTAWSAGAGSRPVGARRTTTDASGFTNSLMPAKNNSKPKPICGSN